MGESWDRLGEGFLVLENEKGETLRPEDFGIPNGMTRPDCPRCGAQALHDMPEGISRCCGACGARVHVWSWKLLPDMKHACPDCGSLNYSWDYGCRNRLGPRAVCEHGRGWCQDCDDWKDGFLHVR